MAGMYQELLDHPVVKALAKKKWNQFGRIFHVFNCFLYVIFLGLLTFNVATAIPPYMHSRYEPQSVETNYSSLMYVAIGVCSLAGIMLFKEGYQLVRMYGWAGYLKKKENYIELGVYFSSAIFAAIFIGRRGTEYTENWQWLLGTVSVFMAWINLLTFAKKFDTLGIYVMMLWKIIKTFLLKVFPIVAILIVTFAIGFNGVRRDKDEFCSFWSSLFTTLSMTTSGVTYSHTFESPAASADVLAVTYTFYCLFIVMMTIIIINLMVGVAVENVQEMQRRATHSNSIFQIEYCMEFEGILVSLLGKSTIFKKLFLLNPTEEISLSELPADAVQEILKLTPEDKVSKTEQVLQEEMLAIKEELASLKNAVGKITNLQKRMDRNAKSVNPNGSVGEISDLRDGMGKISDELVNLKDAVEAIHKMFRQQKAL